MYKSPRQKALETAQEKKEQKELIGKLKEEVREASMTHKHVQTLAKALWNIMGRPVRRRTSRYGDVQENEPENVIEMLELCVESAVDNRSQLVKANGMANANARTADNVTKLLRIAMRDNTIVNQNEIELVFARAKAEAMRNAPLHINDGAKYNRFDGPEMEGPGNILPNRI